MGCDGAGWHSWQGMKRLRRPIEYAQLRQEETRCVSPPSIDDLSTRAYRTNQCCAVPLSDGSLNLSFVGLTEWQRGVDDGIRTRVGRA